MYTPHTGHTPPPRFFFGGVVILPTSIFGRYIPQYTPWIYTHDAYFIYNFHHFCAATGSGSKRRGRTTHLLPNQLWSTKHASFCAVWGREGWFTIVFGRISKKRTRLLSIFHKSLRVNILFLLYTT